MEDFGKRKVGGKLPSAFHPWQHSCKKVNLGNAEASNNSTTEPFLELSLAICHNNSAKHNNDINIDNSTPVKNPIIDGGSSGNHVKAAQTDEIQDRDPKLKRMLSNRAYSQKYRHKKIKYIADLKEKAKSYENKIATLQPQLEVYKNHKHALLSEQHNLKLQMAARERERILKEAEIANNNAKVNMLCELHRARMLNVGAPMQLMSNSNSDSSGLGRLIFSNSNQAQNGGQTSRGQTGKGQQLQNPSQTWVAKCGNGQRLIPDLNIIKSEPMDQ